MEGHNPLWFDAKESVGAKAVQSYAKGLSGKTSLEAELKRTQKSNSAAAEAHIRERMEMLILDPEETKEPFDFIEKLRKDLEGDCETFFRLLRTEQENDQQSKTSRLKSKLRRTRTTKVVQTEGICDKPLKTIDEVRDGVLSLGEDWKKSNGKVFESFQATCQFLDTQKSIFSIFPSETAYTSSLCGALSMIIEASINYQTIGETLSETVDKLCKKVALCTNLLLIVKTKSIRWRLARLYSLLFHYFRSVAQWYLKSGARRFANSFNTNYLAKFNETEKKIEDTIIFITEESRQAGLAMTRLLYDDHVLRQEVERDRRTNYSSGDILGELTGRVLNEVFLKWIQENVTTETLGKQQGKKKLAVVGIANDVIVRAESDKFCHKLEQLVIKAGGSDGLGLLPRPGLLHVDPIILGRLGQWMATRTDRPETLWIITPKEFQAETNARSAALTVIHTAAVAKSPFISYIFERPYEVDAQAAAKSMIYSLIDQLLQFRPPEDSLELHKEILDQITNDPENNLQLILDLFQSLLKKTPVVRYCVIYGLNMVEFDEDARQVCENFLGMLYRYLEECNRQMRLLFSTSGASELLADCVGMEDRIYSNYTLQQVEEEGRRAVFQIVE